MDPNRSRRLPAVLLALVTVAAVSLALMTATSTLTPAVALAAGGHWVVNAAERAVVHVDGGTAQVDARVELPEDAGEPLFALQGERQGFVVARDRVTVFGRSTLTVDTTIPVGFDEVPIGIETVGGPYLVYRTAGTIARLGVPPLSLPVGGPVARPVWTDDGTVWMQRTDDGSICAVRAGVEVLDCSTGAVAGEPGGLSITGSVPAFIGTRQDAAQVVADSLGAPVGLGANVAEAALLADRDTEGRLAVVEPGVNRLVLADSGGVPAGRAGGAAIPVDLGVGEFSSPLASRGVVAVLDLAAGRLLTFDTTGRRLSAVDLPPGTTPTLTRGGDGTLYVDDADGASTHVVGADGSVTEVVTGGVPPESVAVAAPPQRSTPLIAPPILGGPGLGAAAAGPPPTLRNLITAGPQGPVDPSPRQAADPVRPPRGTTQNDAVPRDVVATNTRSGAILLTWTAPVGIPVLGFEIEDQARNPWRSVEPRLQIEDAPLGEVLRFAVRTRTADGLSAQSELSNPIVAAEAAEAPSALRVETVAGEMTGGGETRVTASWTAPDLNGGELVRYEVEGVSTSGDLRIAPKSAVGDSVSAILDASPNSMSRCVEYEVSVRAVSKVGDVEIVGAAAVAETPQTPPSVPRLIEVSQTGPGEVEVVVQPDFVCADEIVAYFDGVEFGSSTSQRIVSNGLEAGRTYQVDVMARNASAQVMSSNTMMISVS